ncbi:hypothetical protein M0804_015324 [Polistes exclamans]|nr:hypothetical protein M0804_015326 [Polistes exclamans]KAI4473482.1 hypothetical protein M0804_015324 [Polistes exclamans]
MFARVCYMAFKK